MFFHCAARRSPQEGRYRERSHGETFRSHGAIYQETARFSRSSVMVEVDRNAARRIRRRPTAWIRPLGYLASIRGVPAFSSVALLHSSSPSMAVSNNRPAFLRCRAAGACGGRGSCCSALGCGRGKRRAAGDGSWELCSSAGITGESFGEESEDDDGDGVSFLPGEVQTYLKVCTCTATYTARHIHLYQVRSII